VVPPTGDAVPEEACFIKTARLAPVPLDQEIPIWVLATEENMVLLACVSGIWFTVTVTGVRLQLFCATVVT